MRCQPLFFAFAIVVGLCPAGRCEVPVTNPSFEDGPTVPTGWALSRGRGELISPGAKGTRAIAVSGDGRSDNAWISDPLAFVANTAYRLRFQARCLKGSEGLAVTGPLFCNRDLSALGADWTQFESYFITPKRLDPDQVRLRFGQWQFNGRLAFDDVQLDRVIPIYKSMGEAKLGSGEMIRDGRYTFQAPLGQASANHARPLAGHQCQFNTHRWVLSSPDTTVTYRHQIGASRQRDATVHAHVGWHQHGDLVIEVKRDDAPWQELGTVGAAVSASFPIPKRWPPSSVVWVRFSARKKTGEDKSPSLQLYAYQYEAALDGDMPNAIGSTHFLAVTNEDRNLRLAVHGIGDAVPGGDNVTRVQLQNTSNRPLSLDVSVSALPQSLAPARAVDHLSNPQSLELAAGATSPVLHFPYVLDGVEPHRLRILVADEASFDADTRIDIPALHATHYGQVLPASTESLGLWWCSSGWKISAQRPPPKTKSDAITIRAAANETEAAQLVIRPQQPLVNLATRVGDLQGSNGKEIPASAIRIDRVGYVHVTKPTDSTGTVGLWPDPLLPLRSVESLEGGRNFPLWIRVHVPRGQAPGLYRGTVSLRAAGVSASIPLIVEVFGFELPDRMTCKTAFGLDTSLIWRYHRLTNDNQRRKVLAKYLQCLSDHHISPYQPAPLDPIRVTWKNTPVWGGGERDATDPHAGTRALKVADDSTSRSVTAQYLPKIVIPPEGLRLRLWHRSTENHAFIVTLQHYDAEGRWMSGRNNDLRVAGAASWKQLETTISQFPVGAKSVQLQLRATLWSDQGTPTGTVWFDDVSLIDVGSAKELVTAGGFESHELPTPEPEFDFAQWDLAMTRAIDQLRFNTFRLAVPGLGGGTFHARYEPELLGYAEDTPQYRGAMQSYLKQLQDHLRNKGWLDEAFVYWFDEPDPKDYAFVNNGFAKLKRWAPEIQRMLTEQVEPRLVGGPNIWCPVSSSYDHDNAQQRRSEGEEFWWYVCTGPKAPYCTLFIDHPATEMRVWLWQTWQRNIKGILVWQSNYWTSGAAYPDRNAPQNPYVDPMGWVSGYSTPAGTRRAWGNGDGRFLYPPEAAANGRPASAILDPPASSIRLEMLRDGIEDYEYLVILESLLNELTGQLPAPQLAQFRRLLIVPPEITSDMTSFTTDPAPIQRRRQAIARAVETCVRALEDEEMRR